LGDIVKHHHAYPAGTGRDVDGLANVVLQQFVAAAAGITQQRPDQTV
jgi:hypothetical protein